MLFRSCKNINEVWAPYNDLTSFTPGNAQTLAFVNLNWNDLTYLDLSNLNFLQRLNVANNQLITLNVTNDPMLTTINVTNNDMLNDLQTEMCPMLRNVIGYNEWDNF